MEHDCFTLYPIYINQSKTVSEGRKFNKNLCVKNPTFMEIKEALKNMDIEFTEEPNKRYPRDFFNYGRVSIKKLYGKLFVIQGLKHYIEEGRTYGLAQREDSSAVSKTPSSKTSMPNKLNLVPRRIKSEKKKKRR